MTLLFDQVTEAHEYLRARLDGRAPSIGFVLGSGLGGFAERLVDPITFNYADIPHFPVSSVSGHAGALVAGTLCGLQCIAMQGRVHYYEGITAAQVAFPVRCMITLGARQLIITNASGGIREDLVPGKLMLICDHINLLSANPLRGDNDPRFGPRFPDMTTTYSPRLRELAHVAAKSLDIELAEGVYVAVAGPTYETPAEVAMLKTLGADATGMSTVPEVIAARHMGAEVLGISCITNKAAGLSKTALTHDHVTDAAARVRDQFEQLLVGVVDELARLGTPSAEGAP